MHPSFRRDALWFQKGDGNRKSFASHSHAGTRGRPSRGKPGKPVGKDAGQHRGSLTGGPGPQRGCLHRPGSSGPAMLWEERRAGGSQLTFHSLIGHLTYRAVGCVRFCEQQRRRTLQLQAVRRGTVGGEPRDTGSPPEQRQGRPSLGSLVRGEEPGRWCTHRNWRAGHGLLFY